MVLVRVSNENRDFYDDFRDEFIPVLWNDCTARLKKLKTVPVNEKDPINILCAVCIIFQFLGVYY